MISSAGDDRFHNSDYRNLWFIYTEVYCFDKGRKVCEAFGVTQIPEQNVVATVLLQ